MAMGNTLGGLVGSGALLALAACAGEANDSGERQGPSPFAPGFELAAAAGVSAGVENGHTTQLGPADFARAIAKAAPGRVRLIDVRTPEEFAAGAIAGAQNIPIDVFDPATLDLEDGSTVLLYCRSGRRSGIALERMAAHESRPQSQVAAHLTGGILAWEAAGYPVE